MCVCVSFLLPEAARLALPLEQAKDVPLPDRSLDVPDDGAGGIVDELDADLSHVTGVAGAAEHAVDLGELDGLVLGGGRGGRGEEREEEKGEGGGEKRVRNQASGERERGQTRPRRCVCRGVGVVSRKRPHNPTSDED